MKFLSLAIFCLLGAAFSASAQVRIGDLKDIKATTAKVVASRTMGNYPRETITIEVSIVQKEGGGLMISYNSNATLEKIEINRSEPVQILNTLFLEGHTTGTINLDAPSYQGSNTYRLVFYGVGKTKGIWTAMVQRNTT